MKMSYWSADPRASGETGSIEEELGRLFDDTSDNLVVIVIDTPDGQTTIVGQRCPPGGDRGIATVVRPVGKGFKRYRIDAEGVARLTDLYDPSGLYD